MASQNLRNIGLFAMKIGIISPNTSAMGIANSMYNNFILKLTILVNIMLGSMLLKLL